MSGTPRLDVGQGSGAFEDVLESLEEAVPSHFRRKAAGTRKCLYNAIRSLVHQSAMNIVCKS